MRWEFDMNEEYAVAFELIAHAGSSRSSSMAALHSARTGDLAQARVHLAEAEAELVIAHRLQTELVQSEARGDRVPVNVILVHAQDHLTSAIVVMDLAGEMVHLYGRIATVADPTGAST